MSRRVTVIEIVTNTGSVWTALGIDNDTDEQVVFGGDWRPLSHIAEALEQGEDVDVEVENWQVLTVQPSRTSG